VLARNETIFKWILYAAAAFLCLLIQTALLQRITVWGVIPFLYPLVAAIPASYEGAAPGMVFALAVGVVSDLILPDTFPCLYTLIFPFTALLAASIAKVLLPSGFLCSLFSAAEAFFLTDLFRCFLLWLGGKPAWQAGAWLLVREFLVTAPLIFPLTLLFRAVYRRAHMHD